MIVNFFVIVEGLIVATLGFWDTFQSYYLRVIQEDNKENKQNALWSNQLLRLTPWKSEVCRLKSATRR